MSVVKKDKPEHVADRLSYAIGVLDGIWWALSAYAYRTEISDTKKVFISLKPVLEKKLNIDIDNELMRTVMKKSILSR